MIKTSSEDREYIQLVDETVYQISSNSDYSMLLEIYRRFALSDVLTHKTTALRFVNISIRGTSSVDINSTLDFVTQEELVYADELVLL